jgi:hypothetical protein
MYLTSYLFQVSLLNPTPFIFVLNPPIAVLPFTGFFRNLSPLRLKACCIKQNYPPLSFMFINLKSYYLRDAPTSLTFNNCTLGPHCFIVFTSEQTAKFATYNHKQIGFLNRDEKCLQRGTD